MTPLPSTQSERRWTTITGPLAWCAHCPTGAFVYHGDGDRTARQAINAAKRHARVTGHDVIVERGQSLRVQP